MKPSRSGLLLVILLMLVLPGVALAQTYSFSVPEETVDVYWHEDGAVSLEYNYVFSNDAFASPIDYIDLGLPNSNFSTSGIIAEVDGRSITDISSSGYQGDGSGVALGLGSNAIQPGQTGRVHVLVGTISGVLYIDDNDENYASAVFAPTWFGSEFVRGATDMTVRYHFPVEVQTDEPRWHAAPAGFSDPPETGFDNQDRIIYTWRNQQAYAFNQYIFGASFPKKYVPDTAIVRPFKILGINAEDLTGFGCCCGIFFFVGGIIFLAYRSTQLRKLQYLPPKVSIEGHGIKRGLTAVEAAILLEQPLDKILTMVLFGVIKKGAASVRTRDPLELDVPVELPGDLHAYEHDLIDAFKKPKAARRKELQSMMVSLVKSVSEKMKGFSRKETVAYYKDIMERAWGQVEVAGTPEVKSQKYNEVMEWTMLDREYDDRTRRVFGGGPVYVPTWWPRYDPGYGHAAGPATSTSMPTGGGGGNISLPHLPGSDFAASMVNGVQDFSSNVIGNLSEFTGGVTNRTNPEPVSTTRSSGGSHRSGGSCACACAGCACACAGGGR